MINFDAAQCSDWANRAELSEDQAKDWKEFVEKRAGAVNRFLSKLHAHATKGGGSVPSATPATLRITNDANPLAAVMLDFTSTLEGGAHWGFDRRKLTPGDRRDIEMQFRNLQGALCICRKKPCECKIVTLDAWHGSLVLLISAPQAILDRLWTLDALPNGTKILGVAPVFQVLAQDALAHQIRAGLVAGTSKKSATNTSVGGGGAGSAVLAPISADMHGATTRFSLSVSTATAPSPPTIECIAPATVAMPLHSGLVAPPVHTTTVSGGITVQVLSPTFAIAPEIDLFARLEAMVGAKRSKREQDSADVAVAPETAGFFVDEAEVSGDSENDDSEEEFSNGDIFYDMQEDEDDHEPAAIYDAQDAEDKGIHCDSETLGKQHTCRVRRLGVERFSCNADGCGYEFHKECLGLVDVPHSNTDLMNQDSWICPNTHTKQYPWVKPVGPDQKRPKMVSLISQ
jgi:hypothetical protein